MPSLDGSQIGYTSSIGVAFVPHRDILESQQLSDKVGRGSVEAAFLRHFLMEWFLITTHLFTRLAG